MDTRVLRYGLAQRYLDAKDYRAAIDELTPLVDQAPDDIGLRMLLARANFHAALLVPAEEQLLAVIERDPTESYAHLMMARTLERQSRHGDAVKYRRIAAALTGDDSLLKPHTLAVAA